MSSDPTPAAGDSPPAAAAPSEKDPTVSPQALSHLQQAAAQAKALKASDGTEELEAKVRALKQVLLEAASCANSLRADDGDDGDGNAYENSGSDAGEETSDDTLLTEEDRAKNQMPRHELAAYNAWCEGSFRPPPVNNWDDFKTTEQQLRSNARVFRAAPADLATLYSTRNLTMRHFAAWLADSSLSTDEARATLKAIARVRRARLGIESAPVTTGPARELEVKVGFKKRVGLQRKEVRFLRALLKSVRIVKKNVRTGLKKVVTELKSVEVDTRDLLVALGDDAEHSRSPGSSRDGPRRRDRQRDRRDCDEDKLRSGDAAPHADETELDVKDESPEPVPSPAADVGSGCRGEARVWCVPSVRGGARRLVFGK